MSDMFLDDFALGLVPPARRRQQQRDRD